jgi:hypothetical protein
VFGKQCSLPSNLTGEVEPLYTTDNYALELKYRLQSAQKEAYENLVHSKTKRKQKYDEIRVKEYHYEPGDLVLLKNEHRSKLEPIYLGPFKVIMDKKPNVELEIKNKHQMVHKDRIKPYILYIN